MKKFLSLFLAFVLMLCLAACDDSGKADPNLGIYKGVSLTMSGETYALSDVYEGISSLELKEDDKAALTLGGETIEGTWKLDGETIKLTVDGVECAGSLKDGTIVVDIMGMEMTFSVKGSTGSAGNAGSVTLPTPGGTLPSPSSSAASSSAPVSSSVASSQETPAPGYYKLNHYISGTEAGSTEFDLEKLQQLGIADSTFLVLNEDGSGRFVMDGDEGVIVSYSATEIVVDSIMTVEITTEGDEITVNFEDSGIFTFKLSDEEPPVPGAFLPGEGSEVAVLPEDFEDRFGGDWHGMAVVSQAEGDLAESLNANFEIIARFAFNEDGSCTPFVYAALSGDNSDSANFKNLSVSYNADFDWMNVNGAFANREIPVDSSCIYEESDGLIYIEILSEDEDGFMYVISALRRLDDEWDYDSDYPYLPEDAVAFYKGKDMYELAEIFGADPSLVPEL